VRKNRSEWRVKMRNGAGCLLRVNPSDCMSASCEFNDGNDVWILQYYSLPIFLIIIQIVCLVQYGSTRLYVKMQKGSVSKVRVQ